MFRWFFLLVGISSIWNCSADSGAVVSREKEGNMFGEEKKKETYVIASPLAGVLLRDGKPMANARLLRRLTWNGNEEGILQEFFTDDQGRFELPVHEEKLRLNFLIQFVSKSTVYSENESDENLIWYSSKLTSGLYSELNDKLGEVICDLSDENIVVHGTDSIVPNIMTRCRWEGMKRA